MLFLMDESQALAEVNKRETEIHDCFLQLAEAENSNIGFIIAYFGTGITAIPPVLSSPDDILSRLGATQDNLNVAIKDLQQLIRNKKDVENFINDLYTKNEIEINQ